MNTSYRYAILILFFSHTAWSTPMAGGTISFQGLIAASTCENLEPLTDSSFVSKRGGAAGNPADQYTGNTVNAVHTRELSPRHFITDIVYH